MKTGTRALEIWCPLQYNDLTNLNIFMTKTTLSAGDLMVIHNTLYKSLNVVGNSIWTQETRERVMDKVSIIMEQMKAEVVCGDVETIVVSGDLGE